MHLPHARKHVLDGPTIVTVEFPLIVSKPAKPLVDHFEIMDSAQLAARLQMPRRSLYNAIARGFVPAGRKIPGLGLRWRVDEIDAWLAQQFSKPNPLA